MSPNKRTHSIETDETHIITSPFDDINGPSSKKLRKEEEEEDTSSTHDMQLELTIDDVALYDRQIRLWGMEAQQRMRIYKILIVGLTGTTTEVCKNLVLAGIGRLTVVDASKVQVQDLGTEFFVTEADIGKNKAEAALKEIRLLNPRVKVDAFAQDVTEIPESYFEDFDLVVLSGADLCTMIRIDNFCRKHGIKFYGAIVSGFIGLFFTDLIHHKYVKQVKKPAITTRHKQSSETKEIYYCPIEDVITKKWGPITGPAKKNAAIPLYITFLVVLMYQQKYGRYPNKEQDSASLSSFKASFLQSQSLPLNFISDDKLWSISAMMGIELPGVSPIIGGILSQDVIKTITGRDEPVFNVFVHDGLNSIGIVLESIPKVENTINISSSRAPVKELMLVD